MDEERRIDPASGSAITMREVFERYSDLYSLPEMRRYWRAIMKPVPRDYRYDQGDRVLCNVGERWMVGRVLSRDVEDPEDPWAARLAYVVKTDAIPGACESNTISAPSDTDGVVTRERCFQAEKELRLAKWVAPIVEEKHRKPLTFKVDDAVSIRVEDKEGGYEQWLSGRVSKVWKALPGSLGEGFTRTATHVPYLVTTDGGVSYFCHRDEHTLIRRPENVPRVPGKSISQRFEKRPLSGGGFEKFDHVTLRGKRVEPEPGSDDD